VVVTGGPGAGKTALLELIRHSFCRHVTLLPEAAGIVFGGGFPRGTSAPAREAAQRAIFHVQRELEAMSEHEHPALTLCDRGTVDGAAFWPDPDPGPFWASVGTTLKNELARYYAVLHLRTPTPESGLYNHSNPLRIETGAEAVAIDMKIARLWSTHPRRYVIEAQADFLEKAAQALNILRQLVPDCCRHHVPAPVPGWEIPTEAAETVLAGQRMDEQC
jgi:predicted ATPase